MATAAEIALALAGSTGVESVRFRYEQRTATNGLIADMTRAVVGCDIEMNNDRAVVRTAQMTIDAVRLPTGFIAPGSNVAVWMDVLVNGAYEAIQLGLFQATIPRKQYRPHIATGAHEVWELSLSDLTIELLNRRVSAPYTIPAGVGYIATARSILDVLGLLHNFSGTIDVTPIAFTWPQDTPYYKILASLFDGINWFPLWSDSSGVFTSMVRGDPFTQTPAVVYHTEQEPRMAMEPYSTSMDVTTGPNRVVALTKDPTRAPLTSIRENHDATSPISTVTLGYKVPKDTPSDYIVSTARLQDYADYTLRDANCRATIAGFQTLIDPRRAPHETYQLYITGVEFGSIWRVNSWKLPCTIGRPMLHTMGKALSLTPVSSS